MGRRATATRLHSRLREVRVAEGLSQVELAERTGLTRQAISAIESGQYVHNTIVALRLAQVLRSSVESLFAIAPDEGEREIRVVNPTRERGRRLAVASVGGQWLGYALDAGHEVQPGFLSADAVLTGGPAGGISIVTPAELIERTALVLGCDPSLSILGAHLARRAPEARLLWLSAASQAALEAVAGGEAHLAGTHLHADGEDNLPQARRALRRTGGLVVEFARWEQGFVTAPGNPKAIRTIDDLPRPDVRLVNREPGSGSRALLDALRTAAGIPVEAIAGYDRLVGSHLAAAAVVAHGGADVALTLRASAQAHDLDFVALDQVRFDFVIPRPYLDHSAVAPLLDLLQSAALRAEIGALPGYEVTTMGTLRAEIPPG